MKNQNHTFTHEDTCKLYRHKKINYFKVFKAVMLFIGLVGILYIGMAVYYLETWNSEQMEVWQYTETFTAQINGQDTVIHTRPDGTREARIVFEYCRPLSWDKNKCRSENEIIGITF